MRKQAGLIVFALALALALALVLPLAAGAATTHESFDVTGTVFPCPTHTYTVTSGAITHVMHVSVHHVRDARKRGRLRHHAFHRHGYLITSASSMRTETSTR